MTGMDEDGWDWTGQRDGLGWDKVAGWEGGDGYRWERVAGWMRTSKKGAERLG